jgi:Cyclin
VASKFYNDVFYGNHYVGYIGGVDLKEINILEKEFLRFINWRLWVDPLEYD